MSYQQFIFKNYTFTPGDGFLRLHYAIDDAFHFEETYKFDFDFVDYDAAALDHALQTLFFLAGVSYYKTFTPPEIVVKAGQIDQSTADFLSETYQKGLGEYWYVNELDPRTAVTFPVNSEALTAEPSSGDGILVGIGGGKDSLVTCELLRDQTEFTTWSLNHREQLEPLIERIGTTHYFVDRQWDPALKDAAAHGARNGHIPISAIFAAVGTIVAILSGHRDTVTSNEQSANEDSLVYQGVPINHQYSKSQDFERLYQQHLARAFGDSLRYYSFLRPLSEVRIAEIFSKVGFAKYKDVFSSCNRAYVLESSHMSWCGVCPKCAFTFLIFTPFVERAKLEQLWGGKNLLLDPELEQTYRDLLGISEAKPLDCVGEVKESRIAMHMAEDLYPELAQKYHYELPSDYDYAALSSHEMPAEIHELFQKAMQRFVAPLE